MTRFWMGAYRLNIELERRPHVPRTLGGQSSVNRSCRCCNLGVVEDELHIMYCPFYTDLRFQFNIFLRGGGQIDHSMRALVNAHDCDRLTVGQHAIYNYPT